MNSSNQVGGLASGFKLPNWDWSIEKYYHHWFSSDQHILGLIRRIGMAGPGAISSTVHSNVLQGRFYPFDAIPQMALFPGLGWGIKKIRFGLVGLYLRLTNNWRSLEKTTVDAWMRKWAGDHVYELMWQPLMIGKFGEHYANQVNMAWLWARIKARTTRLGTFKGGFQAFADRLAEYLRQEGVIINSAHRSTELPPPQRNSLLIEDSTGQHGFDQVLSTSSPELLARLAPDLPDEYLTGLLSLKSMGAVVMVLSLKHQLSKEGYYWYNMPKSAGFPFLALVEHTNYVSPDNFGGEHIVYIGDYLETNHEYFQLSQDELLQLFLPSLKRINPDFSLDWLNNSWLSRTTYAQPVPLVNHSMNIPAIQTPIHGLYFASMSQVYPWDRGTNFAVEIGRKAAGLMLQQTNSQSD